MQPYVSSTQVASSVPFDKDNNPSLGFVSEDVQAALEELKSGVNSVSITNYKITSSTTFTTSSTTDVVITGFTITPLVAGNYAVFYNAAVSQATSGANHDCVIFVGGTEVTDSRRNQRGSASNQAMIDSTVTTIDVNGSQSVDVRVKTNTGSFTVNSRTLILIRLGD